MSIKLGVVGLGRRMQAVLTAIKAVAPTAKVVGLLDKTPTVAKERITEDERDAVKIVASLDELVTSSRPDALLIGTRCDTHASFGIEAEKYGLPVLIEKPVATNLDSALKLEETYIESDTPTLVSFPLRASPLCNRVKVALANGAIGTVKHVQAFNYVNYGNVYFETAYKDYAVTQGLLLQKATHDFDYISWLVGSPIIRTAAMLSCGQVFKDASVNERIREAIYLDHIGTPESGMNEDSSSVLLEFKNGAQAVYSQVFFVKQGAAKRGAIFCGYSGTLSFDWYENTMRCIKHYEPFVESTEGLATDNHFGGDANLARNFVEMIENGASSIAPIECGIASVYACLAAKASASCGQFVDVRQVGCLGI